MEDTKGKEHATFKHRSSFDFVMKVVLLALSVVVVVQFAVVAKGFASLSSINDRLKSLEAAKSSGLMSLRNEKHEPDTRRNKRSVDETDFKNALVKMKKLEERLNQSYQHIGRQPAFLLRGPSGRDGLPGTPGSPGQDGTPGSPGKDGTPGSPGEGKDGRDGRDGAQGARGNPGVPGGRGQKGAEGAKGIQGESGEVGLSYIRWGKRTCPNTGATLVYEGYVGGSYYGHTGSGSNYVCLTRDPIYEKFQSGHQNRRSLIYGGEYQTYSDGIYPSSLHDHDVPCAVCHVTKRASQMMIPGRNVCPAGWTREYKGYLMAEDYRHYRTMYTCVDESPDYTRGTHANNDGALFYFVEGTCISLPCKPYIAGHELTCAVCTR